MPVEVLEVEERQGEAGGERLLVTRSWPNTQSARRHLPRALHLLRPAAARRRRRASWRMRLGLDAAPARPPAPPRRRWSIWPGVQALGEVGRDPDAELPLVDQGALQAAGAAGGRGASTQQAEGRMVGMRRRPAPAGRAAGAPPRPCGARMRTMAVGQATGGVGPRRGARHPAAGRPA